MTTMELEKSISWLGDIYQKFESLCVDAEETMYQDTVKYVEDQILTVGENVKKFYSEVMQDIMLPSSLDAVKEENPLLTVVHQSDVAVIKKPKADNENRSVNAEAERMVKDSEGAANGITNVNCGSCYSEDCSVSKLDEPTSCDTVEEQCTTENCGRKCAELDLPNLATSAVEGLDKKQHSTGGSTSSRSSLGDSVTEGSDKLTRTEAQNESSDPLCELSDNLEPFSVLKVSHCEDNGVGTAEHMAEGYESIDVVGGNKTPVPSSGNLSTECNVSSGKTDPETTITNDVQKSADVHMELFVSDTETSNRVVDHNIESGDADMQGFQLSKQFDKLKLGESCVLVEKSDLSFTLPLDNEQKSYKKKIRNVFSKRWSKGKRDEEQLAVWYEAQTGKDLVLTSIKDSQSNESFESEWELL